MPYFNPPNNGNIQTQNRVDLSDQQGGEFDFSNDGTFNQPTTIAASGYWAVDIRQQTKWLDALNHAPFNALSVSNASAQDIRVYLNTSAPSSIAKKFFVANRTDRLYDLTKVTGFCIENLSTTTAINSGELSVLFIKSSQNIDRLAETLAGSLAKVLPQPKPLFKMKRF